MRYFLILIILCLIGQKLHSQNVDTFTNRNYVDIFNYPNSKTPIKNSLLLKCKVLRIKSVDKAYIIDIKDESEDEYNGYYTIISLKTEKQHLRKIKRGKQYEFVLFAYFDFYIVGDPKYSWGTIYKIEGIPISFKQDFKTGFIVTTSNLKGLYYIR